MTLSDMLCSKFAINLLLKIPLYLKHIASLQRRLHYAARLQPKVVKTIPMHAS